MARLVKLIIACALLAAGGLVAQVPDHPSDLKYEPIVYNAPKPLEHRVELESGVIVYIKEDRLLPTLDVSATVVFGGLEVKH